MENVLVTNITDIPQTVIDIPKNVGVILNPGDKYVIDAYSVLHEYLYKSYQRKGLKVEIVNDSGIPECSDTIKIAGPITEPLEAIEANPEEINELVSEIAPVQETEIIKEEIPAEEVIDVPVAVDEVIEEVKEEPKKRSRKSKNSEKSEK